jgi:hypothetical protein
LEFGKFLAKTIPRAQTEWQKYGWVILSLWLVKNLKRDILVKYKMNELLKHLLYN